MLPAFTTHSNRRTFNYYIPASQADLTSFSGCAYNTGQQLHPQQVLLPKKELFMTSSCDKRKFYDNIKLSQMALESEDVTNSTWSSNPSVMLNTAKVLEWPFRLCLFPNGFIIATIFIPVWPVLSSRSCILYLQIARLTNAPRAICGGYEATRTDTEIASHGVGTVAGFTDPRNHAAFIDV